MKNTILVFLKKYLIKTFKFKEIVFDEQVKNEEIFTALCKNLMDEAFHGINSVIFCKNQE
jgi:hypothetical protein